MRGKTLLILFVVVAGLAAFIWFYERSLPSSERRAELAKRVLEVEKDDVTAVDIEWDGRKVRLERQTAVPGDGAVPAASWRLTEPLVGRADGAAVDRLVQDLTELDRQRTVEDADRAALGLDPPRATVTLERAAGSVVLKVGAEVPASQSLVVETDPQADPVVVSNRFYTSLTKDPGDWRDRDLFPGSRDDVERLTLVAGGGRTLLARRGKSYWLEAPLVDRADQTEVDELLREVTGARATAFLDSPLLAPAEMGLEPPEKVVEAVLGGREEPWRLELGRRVEGGGDDTRLYARVDGQLVETSAKLAELVGRAPGDWRSHSISSLEVYQIESLHITDAAGELTVARAGSDWKRGEDKISYSPVSDLLYALTSAHAARVLGPEEAAAGGIATAQPTLTVTLTGSDGEETVTLYPEVGEEVPARTSGRDAVLMLPRSAFEEITVRLASVREAKVEAGEETETKE